MEDGCAHFGADASPVVSKTDPRAGVDLAQGRVVAGGDGLLAEDSAVLEHREVQCPVVMAVPHEAGVGRTGWLST